MTVSSTSLIRLKKQYKDGWKNNYELEVKKFFLKLWHKLFLFLLCLSFVYQKVFARKSQILLLVSGGEMMMKIRKCIGIVGGNYVTQRVKMVWT